MTTTKPNTFSASTTILSARVNENFDALFTTLGLQDYDLEHNAAGTHKAITATSVTSSGAVSGTTATFTSDVVADGAKIVDGIAQYMGMRTPGFTSNLGLAYASSILSICQAEGSALSTSAYGWVSVPSTTGGELVCLKVSAATHLFEDDGGTSDIAGEEFGTTAGTAWANDRPFYLYAVNSDDSDSGLAFAISPLPHLKQSPAGTAIGYHGNPASSPSDASMFFLTSTDVTTTHASKPCARIGGIRMQKSAADDWTVQTLSAASGDGIRPDPFEGKDFSFPVAQMGGASGSHLSSSGTVPSWATAASIVYKYQVQLDGRVSLYYGTGDAGNVTNGSGGNTLSLTLPYVSTSSFTTDPSWRAVGYYRASGASAGTTGAVLGTIVKSTSKVILYDDGLNALLDNDFATATDDMSVAIEYKILG